MMTLYVLFGLYARGRHHPDSDLTVTALRREPGADQARPQARRHHQGRDAIKALVTQSANDAAVTIAENLAGTEENFAKLMTRTGAASSA